MLISILGSLRIRALAAFSMTGANACHPRVARCLGDRAYGGIADDGSQALGIVDHAGEPRQRLDLAADQQGPQLLELQIDQVHPVLLRAKLRLQALRVQ